MKNVKRGSSINNDNYLLVANVEEKSGSKSDENKIANKKDHTAIKSYKLRIPEVAVR